MADQVTTVQALRDAWRDFVAEREWERFHTPKNLAMGLSVEVAELMEHFLWIENEESRAVVNDPQRLEAIGEEVADVAGYLFCFCNAVGLDLSEAVARKLEKNARKYPAEQYRGRFEV